MSFRVTCERLRVTSPSAPAMADSDASSEGGDALDPSGFFDMCGQSMFSKYTASSKMMAPNLLDNQDLKTRALTAAEHIDSMLYSPQLWTSAIL